MSSGSETDRARIQAIWRAVLTQALQDMASSSRKSEALRAAKAAWEWIYSEDFETVCDMAGYCPLYIRGQVYRAKKRNFQWRLPSGQGWRAQARLKLLQLEGVPI